VFNTFVVYPPGAGGNHLKNLLCLTRQYHNSDELDPTVYDLNDPENRPPGEVWCVGGRNLQDRWFDIWRQDPSAKLVLPAHFGELWQKRQKFCDVPNKRLVILGINSTESRRALESRHQRLGQTIHPYWLDEELPWLYQAHMYDTLFGISAEHCVEIDLLEFWHQDMNDNGTLAKIEQLLDVQIPRHASRLLHQKWVKHNFGPYQPV
jgi:hypothetical protein